MIIHNATVHSPVERFATALHIEDGTIVWLGDEDTAEFRARAHPQVPVVDALGALITPAFHHTYARTLTGLHAQGITAAHVLNPPDPSGAEGFDLTPILTGPPQGPGPAIHLLRSGASTGEVREFFAAERPPTTQPAVEILSAADLATFVDASSATAGARVYLDAAVDLDVSALAHCTVTIVVNDGINAPLAEFARIGIPYSLAGRGTPWQLITRTLFEGPDPISARSAFNALTRGPWRLTPGRVEPRGVLRVGAPADIALWDAATLAVQAPDEETAFWSTDQRAGTPLLPALGAGEEEPVLLRLLRGGSDCLPTEGKGNTP